MHTYIYVYICVCIHICIHTYKHAYEIQLWVGPTCIYMNTYTCMYVYMYCVQCTYTYIYMYMTHIYIYVYRPTCWLAWGWAASSSSDRQGIILVSSLYCQLLGALAVKLSVSKGMPYPGHSQQACTYTYINLCA